jgi:hypothetical protein
MGRYRFTARYGSTLGRPVGHRDRPAGAVVDLDSKYGSTTADNRTLGRIKALPIFAGDHCSNRPDGEDLPTTGIESETGGRRPTDTLAP